MSTNITYNGLPYQIPSTGQVGWGQEVSTYLIALSTGSLTTDSGSFPLLQDVNFGPNYGVVAPYFKSYSGNIAATGVVRLANTDKIVWRNNANSADLALDVTTANRIRFNGAFIDGTVSTVSVTTANGVSGTVANATTTPAISLTLGAITPSSVAATGIITAASIQSTPIGSVTPSTGAFSTLTASSTATLSSGTINNMSVGATTRSTGAFTTLTANAAVTLSPANAAVVLSPTGTGVVTVAPATLGTINNMSVGATTRSTGAFTTLTANGATTLTAGTASTTTTSGTLVVTGGLGVSGAIYAGSIQSTPIGATTRSTGAFTTLTSNGATTVTASTSTVSPTTGALVVTGGVGISGQIRTATNALFNGAQTGFLGVAQGTIGSTISAIADTFVIESSDTNGMSILTPNNRSGNIFFADTDSLFAGSLVYNHATDKFEISSNATLSVTISSTTLDANNVSFTSFGYKSGTGATVAQLTSKSTGVTINATCGRITMVNTALAANTVVSFTMTNSTISNTDIVLVNIGASATAGAYIVQVDSVGSGTCRISLRNMTAGSLSEAVGLNFGVMNSDT